ncbi:MAG: hypothetical protein ACYS83_03240 [Planctomycetota bacterium]|jgi:hypothetical protein
MSAIVAFVTASFTAPENIGTTPGFMLWLLPLAVATTVVYKATKLPTITASDFIKKVAATLGFGIVLLIIIVLALHALARLITE